MKSVKGGFTILEILFAIIIFTGLCFANLFENFKIYPVTPASGTLKYDPATGVQWSDSINATVLDTFSLSSQAVYKYIQVDYGYAQRRLYLDVQSFYTYLIVRTKVTETTGTPPTAKWWIDAKDTTYSWQIISDTMEADATAETSFTSDTAAGYIDITQLPAQLRIGLKSDSGRAVLQLSSESYIDVWTKTLE